MNLVHAVYEPPGPGPHPTLLTLHGFGANALDLLGLAPHISHGKFLVLCPQGPLQLAFEGGGVGYGWYPFVGSGVFVGSTLACSVATATTSAFVGRISCDHVRPPSYAEH